MRCSDIILEFNVIKCNGRQDTENMKILVCMKQVPAGTKVDIDPETGAMKRMSGATRTNPYDLFALETALRIREQQGGTVTVLTMGPPQAEEMMRDAYTMGADDAVILSDRKFAGADVLATSYALSQAIQVLGGADLILCGRQTTDGDTAQVGPAYASCGVGVGDRGNGGRGDHGPPGSGQRDPGFQDPLSVPDHGG